MGSAARFGRMDPPSQVDSTSILVGGSVVPDRKRSQTTLPHPTTLPRLHSNTIFQHLRDRFLPHWLS